MAATTPPRIALTPGEPGGIGLDITLKLASRALDARLVCIADPAALKQRAAVLGIDVDLNLLSTGQPIPTHRAGALTVCPIACAEPVPPGQTSPLNAPYLLECLRLAAAGCLDGTFDAMVTGPLSKAVINDSGIAFTGHTEYLAGLAGGAEPVMLLCSGSLRVALVTTHLPLREVPAAVTRARVLYALEVLASALRAQFDIPEPRIAVLGLNPHAGESGHLGREDGEVIAPAAADARARRIDVTGPLPADTAFTAEHRARFDAYLAMYHDQGLPVVKALGFGATVNVTLGLPIIRTSVDHGTALDLAGSGLAREDSLMAAMDLALRLCGAANASAR